MVSQMAHAKNLGELFMAHLENLYNIRCIQVAAKSKLSMKISLKINLRSSTYILINT